MRASAPYERSCKANAVEPSTKIEPPLAMDWILPFNRIIQVRWSRVQRCATGCASSDQLLSDQLLVGR